MNAAAGRRLLPLLTAFALSACGGGMTPSSTVPAGTSTNAASDNVQLAITLPGTVASATVRKPAFVSTGTQGASISAYAHTDTAHANPIGSATAAVGPGAPGCSSSAPVTCTVPISVPPSSAGNSDDFVVTLYNQAPSGGTFSSTAQVLGIGTIASQIVTANSSNTLQVPVLGMPASGVVSFGTAAVQGGIASYYPLTVKVLDASSQPIQGTFASPVQLTTTSPGITSFIVNGVAGTTVRSSTDSVQVSYTGGQGSASLSLTGSFSGFTAVPFSFIPSSGTPAASPASPIVQIFGTTTFTVSEPNYTGIGYSETDNCGLYTPPNATTITQTSLSGGTATFTINGGFVPGYQNCTATIVDTVGQTLSVIVQIQNNT